MELRDTQSLVIFSSYADIAYSPVFVVEIHLILSDRPEIHSGMCHFFI